MLIKAIEVGYLQTNCYVVADEATLDAAVIDPGADSNLILDYIERCHFHVRAILLTHGHFDHCMGLEEVYDATGATVYMSHADLTTDIGNGMFGNEDFELDPPDDTVFVREGDVIEAGSLTFDVLETPGHTPGGISFLDVKERIIYTGDACNSNTLLSSGDQVKPKSGVDTLLSTAKKLIALEPYYDRDYNGHIGYAANVTCLPMPASINHDAAALCKKILSGEVKGEPQDAPFGGNSNHASLGAFGVRFDPEQIYEKS